MANESMRKILIGLITDKNFVKEYIKTFPEAQFKGMVGVSLLEKWSRAYYLKYGDAMKSNVRVALDRMIQGKRIGEDDLRYIEMLLQSLSAESDAEEATPVEYLLDLAVQEINRINLAKIAEQVTDNVSRGDVSSALKAYENFKKVEKGEELPKISLIDDVEEVVNCATSSNNEAILTAHSNNPFEEELFSQILPGEYTLISARSKGFKTFITYTIALDAAIQKKNVLLFSLGDLNKQMSMKRLMSLLLHKPSIQAQEHNMVKVPHIDCCKNKMNLCYNINRTCNTSYEDENGDRCSDYVACTACAKCGKAFPVCVTHTEEDTGSMLTEADVTNAMKALKAHMGEGKVFDFYAFSACDKTMNELSDIVGSYFDKGIPIDLVCIDYWGQVAIEPSDVRLPQHQAITNQAIALKNMALKYNVAVVIADQATIRPTENGMSSEDLLTASAFTGSANKLTYTSSCINSNVQSDDRRNSTIKLTTSLSRYGLGLTLGNGYVLVCNAPSKGKFAYESFHVTEDHIKAYNDFIKENNLDDDKKKRRK